MVFLILWCSICRKLYEWSASMKQHDGVILTNYSAVTLPWEYHQEICNLLENHVGSSPSVVKHLPVNYCIICHYLFLSKHKLGYFLLRGCAICHVWRHLLLYILESIQWWCKHQTKVTTWKFWKFLAKYKLFYKSCSLKWMGKDYWYQVQQQNKTKHKSCAYVFAHTVCILVRSLARQHLDLVRNWHELYITLDVYPFLLLLWVPRNVMKRMSWHNEYQNFTI